MEWTFCNRLSLNIDKTKALLFSNRLHDVVTPQLLLINSSPVYQENHLKFLGVNIDRKLDFSEHVKYICSKISKTIGILHRVIVNVPRKLLINMYYTLIYPYFKYCILVWGDNASVHLNPLILLQKKIIRVINFLHYLAPTRPLFAQMNILRLRDIHNYFLGIHMFQQNSSNLLSLSNHTYNTRSRSQALPTFQRLTQTQRSLSFKGPHCWNKIPTEIRSLNSLCTFKRKYKKFLASAYQDQR